MRRLWAYVPGKSPALSLVDRRPRRQAGPPHDPVAASPPGSERPSFPDLKFTPHRTIASRAGARDLRPYTFLPWACLVHPMPDVFHDNPAFRRYHASVGIGTESRAAMAELLKSEQIAGLVADQHTVLTAVHIHSAERSVPVIRM